VAALQRSPTAGPFSLCELCVSVVAIRLIGAIGIRQETAKRRLRTRLASGQVAALQKRSGRVGDSSLPNSEVPRQAWSCWADHPSFSAGHHWAAVYPCAVLSIGPVITVEDFHKAYGDTLAVSGLSFEVSGGEILGLVGPNGAGKTTTLRAITGIIPPTKGTLRVNGHDVVADPVAAKRDIAYIPDDPRLFDALTVWEHLEFTASAYRVGNFKPVAERLIQDFELAEQRNTMSQELSRGMRQKVSICCAYLYEPKVILYDEPLTGLDPRGIRTLKQSVVDRAGKGVAIIISSHLLSLIEDLCTHLLILHRGKRLFFGRVSDARTAFAQMGADASLEDVFFHATEPQPPPLPGQT